jgi:hypothetical protein
MTTDAVNVPDDGTERVIPIRVGIDSPAPAMVRLDRTITLNIVLMQMVRSSRTMTSKGRRHVSTSRRIGIRATDPQRVVFGNGHLERGMHLLTKPFAIQSLATRVKELMAE